MAKECAMPEPKFVTIDGLKLQYFDWGNEKAPTLLFQHGGTGHPVTWSRNVGYFMDKYHCVALTQRGHAGSDFAPPNRYTRRDMMIEIAKFIDAMDFKKVSFVGSSSGGMLCAYYAATHPERVEKVAFTEMPPVISNWMAEFTRRTLMTLKGEFDSYKDFYDYMRLAKDPQATDESFKPYADFATKQLPNGKVVFKYDINFERAEYEEALEQVKMLSIGNRPVPDYWRIISEVMCPTLIIRATQSALMDRETMKRMIAVMPNARAVEIECGHVVFQDAPDEFNKAVMDFLQGA